MIAQHDPESLHITHIHGGEVMKSLLDLTTIKPIFDGLAWLMTLGEQEIKHVKDETQELLGHLSKSLKSLWEITTEVARLSDQDFKDGFAEVYHYFKLFYYDPEPFEKARTHCSDLRRDIGRIEFKLANLLRTDIGNWSKAEQALQLELLEDYCYINEYRKNFELLNTRLNDIHSLLRQGKDDEALKAYQALRTDLSGDLDHLNIYIQRMREADTYIRQIVG